MKSCVGDSMITILHIAPNLKPGGPAQMAADLACALQHTGATRNIVLSPANELVSRIIRAKAEHRLCRVPSLFNISAEIDRLKTILRKLRPDAIQVYSPLASFMVRRACKAFKKNERPPCFGVITSYPNSCLFIQSYKYCVGLGCGAWHLRKLLLTKGFKTRKLDLLHIPYGVNEHQCNPQFCPSTDKMAQWKARHPESIGKFTLCIPGAITPLHGLEDLIPILTSLLKQGIATHAYIAGDTRKADATYVKKLQDAYAESSLAEHISWIGARPDLREVLCTCDVTLSLAHHPSTCDRPVLEALALGRPVIGYDHGIVGELLEVFLPEGRVKPHDTAAITDILSQWHMYSPSTVTSIPYPYRLSDTAAEFLKMYRKHIKTNET